jgi:thioredoxin 1
VLLHDFHTPTESCPTALCILRFDAPRARAELDAIRAQLVDAGAFESDDEEEDDEDDDNTEDEAPPSAFLVGAWIPRDDATQAAALAALRTSGGHEAWLLAVETHIDGLTAIAREGGMPDDYAGDWLHGLPPLATSVPFAFDNYPDILEAWDADDFGIALKLATPAVPGEAEVFTALHHAWITAYVDPRVDGVPFGQTGVTFDEQRRAVLLWMDEDRTPTTAQQLVEHLLWIAGRLHAIVPVAHGRFIGANDAQKAAAHDDDGPTPLVLAGNPLQQLWHERDQAAALAWAEQQRTWSKVELAAMFVELGTDFDPDDEEQSATATQLFDRASTLDPDNDDAPSYAQQTLVRSGRVDEALARAGEGPSMRAFTFGLVVEHAPDRLRDALPLIDAKTLDAVREERVGELLAQIGGIDTDALLEVLPRLPRTVEMITPIYNAAFKLADLPTQLRMLELAMELPEPHGGHARSAYTFAFNNACVHAHAMKDYERARVYADRAQPYAAENPYIYHAAACAYAAVGELEKAMQQVEAVAASDYDKIDQVERDTDLGELLTWPRFAAAFAARRERLARSEPVLEVDSGGFAQALDVDRPVLVDFTATWCGPCKRQSPILDKLAENGEGRFRIVKVDIDESPDLAERYDANSVPTLVVFRGGEEVARTSGLTQRDELLQLIAAAQS